MSCYYIFFYYLYFSFSQKHFNILLILYYFYMSGPINFSHLPQISLSKLYESTVTDKSGHGGTSQITGGGHQQDIIVLSPFYERPKNCKGACTCNYHRMKRYKQLASILRFQQNNKMRDQISHYKSRIAEAVRASNSSTKSKYQPMNPKPRKYRQTQKLHIDDLQNRERRIRIKENLDNYNSFFENILRKRLQPMQDHEKVASLIKFIKFQSNINPNYLKKIRDHICINLLKIVQKIPFNTLLQAGEDEEQIIKKIASIINGKYQQGLEFLRGFKQSMKDMENYLIERQKSHLNRKQQVTQQKKQSQKRQNLVLNDKKSRKQNSKTEKSLFNESDDKISVEDSKTQNEIILGTLNFKNDTNISSSAEEKIYLSDPPLSPKKRGTFPSKKSNISHNQSSFLENKIKSSSRSTFKQSCDLLKQIDKKRNIVSYDEKNLQQIEKENQEQKKERYHFNSIMLMKKKSSKKLKEFQEKTEEILIDDEIVKIKIKASGQGKKRIVSKIKKIPNPFNSIQYGKLISNEEFDRIKYLLSQHNTLAVNQQMQKLLSLIQRKLSTKPQFLEEFIEIFSKVLTPEQIKILRQKHHDSECRKMIQKLTKQVDQCIYDLKQSKGKVYKDDEQETSDKGNMFLKNLLNLQFSNNEETLFDEFDKFKIVEKTPPPAIPIEEPLLDQKQLGDLFIEHLIQVSCKDFQKLTQVKNIKNNNFNPHFTNGKVDEQKHRQILRYMKKNHPCVFDSVKQNIKDTLCNNI